MESELGSLLDYENCYWGNSSDHSSVFVHLFKYILLFQVKYTKVLHKCPASVMSLWTNARHITIYNNQSVHIEGEQQDICKETPPSPSLCGRLVEERRKEL